MNNILQMLPQFKQNPAKFLGNIQGVNMQDPNAIIQYGLNNGRFTQQQYNQAVQLAQRMGLKK